MPRLHSLIAGLGALSALTAPMLHPHPSGSTDRVTPGAVRVESSSHVRITLLDDRGVIKQLARDYDVDLAKGSGFTVTPDGVVVTATQVVQDADDPRVYAANRVFAEYFKVKIPADFKRHSLDDPDLDRRLRACYPPQQTDSTCIADVTTNVTVYPYLDPPPPGGLPAQILTTGTSPSSPAVLKVTKGGEKQSLPTVPLGTTIGGAVESLDVMSLPGRPSAKTPPKLDTAHLNPPGSRTVKERDKVLKLLDDGAPGAALIDDGKSEVVGFVSGGGGEQLTITPADDIRSALVAAGVTPRRGPVDVVYENALASYHNKLYTGAIPALQQVLNLRPDHAVAAGHLRVAQSKAGTAEDAGSKAVASPAAVAQPKSSVPPYVWAAGGVVVLALLAVGVVLLRRRSAARAGAGGQTDPALAAPGDAVQGEFAGEAVSYPPPENSWPPYAVTRVFGAEAARSPDVVGPPPAPVPADPSPAGGQAYPVDLSPPHGHAHPEDVSPPRGHSYPPNPSPPRGQAQLKFCTQCGMRLGQGHRFCGFCGNPVDS
ncbi:zinc ribbon domain-containing protein [Microbispora hainanensis]|uniref:Zinc ribbon domain-containing protein n=1 Tax=Microbispora hainanensis TaxID=568844 RepID=A0A544YD88_9ACTN|nr:zinc ribbon domain-containing protein [Microbispora hainanensis]TQS14512.1 zinc ribbon domain-containing protein [Microbispora hainanensis]